MRILLRSSHVHAMWHARLQRQTGICMQLMRCTMLLVDQFSRMRIDGRTGTASRLM